MAERTETGTRTESDDDAQPSGGPLPTARRLISPLVEVWMAIVRAFSWLVARIVAAVLFVVGFIPYGIVMRLIRFDPLRRDLDTETETFWQSDDISNDDIEQFRRLY